MNTTENNKLIAVFLGAKITDIAGLQSPIYYPILGKSVYAHKLKFHSDWNWLMGVVEKIESLNFIVYIESNYCQVYGTTNREELVKSIHNTKIESVYNACIEFIKWYNEQQK